MTDKKRLFSAFVLIYIGAIINFKYPVLRFDSARFNLIFFAVVQLLPIALFTLSFQIKNLLLKILSVITFALLSVISVLAIVLIALNIGFVSPEGNDPAFENLKAIQIDEYNVVAYRVNGGATVSYSMVVRQEKLIAFGVKLVKELYRKYREGDVDLNLENHLLHVNDEEFRLKKNIYF